MSDVVRRWVLRFLRVPAEPTAPEGGRVIRVFRAAPAYYRYRLAFWLLRQLGSGAALVIGVLVAGSVVREIGDPHAGWVLAALEGFAWVSFLAQAVFSYMVLRLDFEMRWYILSDRSLRIREGIASVREKTVTFANIQQISIRQNPLQRLVGIADVQVTTAGGGGSGQGGQHGHVGESMHEAYFRGVDNAEEIRGVIRERVRRYRDSGLGDPDEPGAPLPAAAPVAAPDALGAARELLNEMRLLRQSLT